MSSVKDILCDVDKIEILVYILQSVYHVFMNWSNNGFFETTTPN
jgi:hypothetical protein